MRNFVVGRTQEFSKENASMGEEINGTYKELHKKSGSARYDNYEFADYFKVDARTSIERLNVIIEFSEEKYGTTYDILKPLKT